MHKQPLALAVAPGWALGAQALHAEGIVISEILYHPASTNRLEEWLELRGNSAELFIQ